MFIQIVAQLLVGDPRFDQSGAELGIDRDDPVHPLEIEYDLPGRGAAGHAIAHVLAGGDWPDRLLEAIGDADNVLHLRDGDRADRADRRMATAWIGDIGLGPGLDAFRIARHPLVTHHGAHRLDRAGEIGLPHTGGERLAHCAGAGKTERGGAGHARTEEAATIDREVAHCPFSRTSSLLVSIQRDSASSSRGLISVGRKAGMAP